MLWILTSPNSRYPDKQTLFQKLKLPEIRKAKHNLKNSKKKREAISEIYRKVGVPKLWGCHDLSQPQLL